MTRTDTFLLAIILLLAAQYFRAERERIDGTFPSSLGTLLLLAAGTFALIGVLK